MEIGSSRCQSSQNRSLDLADIGALTGNQCPAGVGDDKALSCQGPRRATRHEYRQPGNVQCRGTVGARIGDADIEGRLDGMITDVWGVMTGAAKTRNTLDSKHVIKTPDTGNVDLRCVEKRLSARD